MKATVRVNFTKWDSCKEFGEEPKAFVERITNSIEGVKGNALRYYYEELDKETDKSRIEWLEGAIAYEERKIRRLQKEIAKATKEM